MLPGPDFALVMQNTLLHSRRSGLYTAFGIATATLVHMSYCILGLAIVISESVLLFNLIKYIGGFYLIYLGITALFSKSPTNTLNTVTSTEQKPLSSLKAFSQGFLCNLLNPKATLFFLALFTLVIKSDTANFIAIVYVLEIFIIVYVWFFTLAMLLAHPFILKYFNKVKFFIPKILGIYLIGFGIVLVFA